MITSPRSFTLRCAAAFLVAGTIFQPAAAENQRYADGRIPIEHARRATARQDESPQRSQPTRSSRGKRQSLVAQAAHGKVPDSMYPPPVRVQQVGFLEQYGSNCGPVCDCGNCEVACGVEAIYHEDPGCGVEIGCGVGAAIGHLGPVIEHGCGVEDCGGCGSCDSCCGGMEGLYVEGCVGGPDCGCDSCCDVGHMPICIPFLRVNWARFDFFAGFNGFKGPLNYPANSNNPNDGDVRQGSGSFGFYQGFNEGRSLRPLLGCDLAAQLGVRATQTNLSTEEFTADSRNQVFVTGGLFRRVDYGLQYGLVVDYLSDDWYFRNNALQLRGELSWRQACHVAGFQFMAGLRTDTSGTVIIDDDGNAFESTLIMRPTDQYRFFYRHLTKHAGQWSAFGGWTDHSDGLLGVNFDVPMRQKLVLSTGATYLVPNEGSRSGGNREESWNISMGVIWRVGGPKGCGPYCRPLFDVADNGTFMIDRL